MNCSEARPLLLAGDLAADAHLEACAACGRWLEANDPVVSLIRSARPEALPAPTGLRDRILVGRRWRSRGWLAPVVLGGSTAGLLVAAFAALVLARQDLLTRAADLAAPLLNLFQGPRDLLFDNLPALLFTICLGVLAMTVAGIIYRDLGPAQRGTA